MKKFCLSLFCFWAMLCAFSQQQENFKPSGKIIARAFLDYSNNFDNESGFDITRAFLGYEYKFAPTLTGQVIIDGAAGTKDDRLEVYVRNAFISWKDYNFEVNAGLTGLLQFSLQEKYWMHRYVMNSFQDLNKMASSVDLGFTAKYNFTPFLSADFSLTNGSGHKEVKKSGSKCHALGVTLSPVKDMVFRVYGDVYNESEEWRDELPADVTAAYKNQYTLSLFAGYQNPKVSGGAEYNRVYNKGFIEDKDYYGCSFYTSAGFLPKWRVYARYDITDSAMPDSFIDPWNGLDGQLLMAGVEFTPVKYMKISPNFRNINPDRSKSVQYLFVNLEFSL